MKTLTHKTIGRNRIMGYNTGDTDLSIVNYELNEITGESTHIHTESSETYYIIEGKGTVWIKDKIYRLRPGTTYKVEPNEPHRMLTVFKAPLKGVTIKVPDYKDNKVRVDTPPELMELMKKHGIE